MDNAIISEFDYVDEEGALRFKGARYLLIRPETLAALQRAVESEVGAERAGELLYAGGFAGGRLSGVRFRDELGLSDRQAVEFMCRMGGQIGWGRFDLVGLDEERGRLVVEVQCSPFAASYGAGAEAGVCHVTRGVLGGLANGLFDCPVAAREVLCAARGDGRCRFEIAAAAD